MENKINEINNLIQILNNWTKAYDEGQPLVSDKEWDELYFKLKQLEEETGIILPDSPTNKITYESKYYIIMLFVLFKIKSQVHIKGKR